MSADPRRIPDYLLERLAGGDLPDAERAALLEELSADPDGRDRLATLARDDAETLARLPAGAFVARVAERARPAHARRRGTAWLLVPAAGAAVAVTASNGTSTWPCCM